MFLLNILNILFLPEVLLHCKVEHLYYRRFVQKSRTLKHQEVCCDCVRVMMHIMDIKTFSNTNCSVFSPRGYKITQPTLITDKIQFHHQISPFNSEGYEMTCRDHFSILNSQLIQLHVLGQSSYFSESSILSVLVSSVKAGQCLCLSFSSP